MKTLRTPDERFADLADYDFEPHYTRVPDGDEASCGSTTSTRGPRTPRSCSACTESRRGRFSTAR